MGTVLLSISAVVVLVFLQVSSAAMQTETRVNVVGQTECLDCAEKSIKTETAVKGEHDLFLLLHKSLAKYSHKGLQLQRLR